MEKWESAGICIGVLIVEKCGKEIREESVILEWEWTEFWSFCFAVSVLKDYP